MRSSIACVRCRRSKVKCVNTGPNTTCKACETTNRECTYPQPVQSGVPRAAAGGMTISSVTGGGPGGTVVDRIEAPKKPKVKKPPSVSGAATTASMNTPKFWKECLESPALTQAVWKLIFDAFQLHHSPLLPFLHPPTFLNRLRASAPSTTSSGSSPPAPEKPHSPLLLLGLLALTARHIPALVTHYTPALPTPTAVSEFYAAALKYRLKNDEDDDLFSPSLEKIQALVMLSVHEWGQARAPEAYMWLGLAIRMSGRLQLTWVDDGSIPEPSSPELESDGPATKRRKLGNGTSVKSSMASTVDKEIRRRTFWSVFILDRAFSSSRCYPSGVSSTEASRVQLPCEERGFMFGTSLQSGYLCPNDLLNPRRNGEMKEAGGEERILAQIVKAMEIFGKIQEWADMPDHAHPTATSSEYHRLSSALEMFVATLPQQLEFSLDTLQVHTSTQSSSAYAVLHATLFLARMTLEKRFLPRLPLVSNAPLGPQDPPPSPTAEEASFYAASAERLFASGRDFVTLIAGLEEWNACLDNPLILAAINKVADAGLYAFSFPWMDQRGYLTGSSVVSNSSAMGSGEDARRAVELLATQKQRWQLGEEYLDKLVQLQSWFAEQKDGFIHRDPAAARDPKFLLLANSDERRRLLSLLSPATPKTSAANISATTPAGTAVSAAHDGHHGGRHRSNSEVDTLLLAASTTGAGGPGIEATPVSNAGVDRWMAVNKLPASATQQASQPVQQQIHPISSPPQATHHHQQQHQQQPPQHLSHQPSHSHSHSHSHSRSHSLSGSSVKDLTQQHRSPNTPASTGFTLDTLAGYAAEHKKLSSRSSVSTSNSLTPSSHQDTDMADIKQDSAPRHHHHGSVTLPPPQQQQQQGQWSHQQHSPAMGMGMGAQRPDQSPGQRSDPGRWSVQQGVKVGEKEKGAVGGQGAGSAGWSVVGALEG